jgi:hypothetical protein
MSQAPPDGDLSKVSHHRRLAHGQSERVFGFNMNYKDEEKVERFFVDFGWGSVV